MRMTLKLDDNSVFAVLPRIVTSMIMEFTTAQQEKRDVDLSSIRVNDPKIANIN
jgi:hypothetical protein